MPKIYHTLRCINISNPIFHWWTLWTFAMVICFYQFLSYMFHRGKISLQNKWRCWPNRINYVGNRQCVFWTIWNLHIYEPMFFKNDCFNCRIKHEGPWIELPQHKACCCALWCDNVLLFRSSDHMSLNPCPQPGEIQHKNCFGHKFVLTNNSIYCKFVTLLFFFCDPFHPFIVTKPGKT